MYIFMNNIESNDISVSHLGRINKIKQICDNRHMNLKNKNYIILSASQNTVSKQESFISITLTFMITVGHDFFFSLTYSNKLFLQSIHYDVTGGVLILAVHQHTYFSHGIF